MEKLWRLRDIAQSWDVDYTTLWRWCQSGKIQKVKLPGNGIRIKDSEIRRVLGETREPVTA